MNERQTNDRGDSSGPAKLIGFRKCRFCMRAEEGLAIHGSESGLEIGSTVQPNLRVVLNAATGRPYIPGSSLKGKLRSTLEKILGNYASNGAPHACGKEDCIVCVVFGAAPAKESPRSSPTRIVVRDAQLHVDSLKAWDEAVREPRPVLELKTESLSNRATGAAILPRTGERVPPGTEFQGEIILREFEGDPTDRYIKVIQDVMKFVEESDGIGSGISRGSGKVSFVGFHCEAHKAPAIS